MAIYKRRGSGRRLVQFGKRRLLLTIFSFSLSFFVYLSFFGVHFPFLGLHDGQVNQRTTTIEIVNSRWKYAHDHLAGIIYNSPEVKDSHIVADQGFHNSTVFPKLGFRYNNERNASHGRTDGDTPTVINATKSEVELSKPTKSKSRKRYGPCDVDFKETVDELVEPASYTQFSLNYVTKEEKPNDNFLFEPKFGGHQTLE